MYISTNQRAFAPQDMQPPLLEVTFKEVARSEPTCDSDDYCEGYVQTIFVKVETVDSEEEVDQHDIGRCVAKYYDHRCYCDYDCCGHRFGGATVQEYHSDKLIELRFSSSRNY